MEAWGSFLLFYIVFAGIGIFLACYSIVTACSKRWAISRPARIILAMILQVVIYFIASPITYALRYPAAVFLSILFVGSAGIAYMARAKFTHKKSAQIAATGAANVASQPQTKTAGSFLLTFFAATLVLIFAVLAIFAIIVMLE